MSKDLQPPNQSDEVDLGQLFKLIGNAFDRFFKFIFSIIIGVYNISIIILTHFYKRRYWYLGAILIGFVIGFVMDEKSDKLYGANLFIETNFSSTRQVYENIQQFHQLANKDKDTIELAKRLNISTNLASKLKGFYIEPDLDENSMAEMYSDFYLRLDSLSRLDMTFDRYKKSLTPYNFKVHKIGVASANKMIYKEIEDSFVDQISDNPYLNKLVEVNKLNLEKKDKVLLKQVQITDSLVNEYLKIRIKESEKEPIAGAGTNLYMGNAQSTNLIVDESTILDKRLSLEAQRRQINVDMAVEQNVINVLADFPYSGYDIKEWYDKMKYLLPLGLLIFTLITFLTIRLGNFLKKQNNL